MPWKAASCPPSHPSLFLFLGCQEISRLLYPMLPPPLPWSPEFASGSHKESMRTNWHPWNCGSRQSSRLRCFSQSFHHGNRVYLSDAESVKGRQFVSCWTLCSQDLCYGHGCCNLAPSWAWWHIPVLPVISSWEAEAGGLWIQGCLGYIIKY